MLQLIFFPLYRLFFGCIDLIFPIKNNTFKHDICALFKNYLWSIYYTNEKEEKERIITKSKNTITKTALTLGDTLFFSLALIFKNIPIKKNMTFYDLGCGTGRLVFFAAHFYQLNAVGIEIRESLAAIAQNQATKSPLKNIEFINESFLSDKIKLNNADIIFVTTTCLSDNEINHLKIKVNNCKPNTYIISTSCPIKTSKTTLIKTLYLPFAWGFGHVYIQKVPGT